jgi:hypothetical protein
MAIRIQDKINDRFSTGAKIATAETPAFVAIEIPPQFKGREAEFLALVRHLYVTQETGFDDRRTAELATEILDPRAPHDNIALAWEGLGKSVKSTIRNLYDNAQSYVSFHAARTGLRLNDNLAIRVMERHAADPKSPYQEEAITELGHAVHTYRAAKSLLRLIDQDLDRAALSLAYEGLVEHNDPALMSLALGGQFVLDRLDSPDAKAMIYAKIEDQARMVLFGDVRFKAPLFYRHAQGLITMNAPAEGVQMTLIRQTPSGRSSPTINAPLDVYGFIRLMGRKADQDRGQVTGLGLTYPQIIDIISSLCADGSIDADFRLERPEAADYAKPKRLVGRPESEL